MDRLLNGLSVLVLGVLVAGMLAWFLLIARHPGVRGSEECRAAYRRAHSATDSAIIDARVPVASRTREAELPTCGTLRRSGELR